MTFFVASYSIYHLISISPEVETIEELHPIVLR